MNDNRIGVADFLSAFSILLGICNLTENEQQSEQQVRLLQGINVQKANDEQARYLLEELGRKFDEQNAMLKEILEAVSKWNRIDTKQ